MIPTVSDHLTMRLYLADNSSQTVQLSLELARREWYRHAEAPDLASCIRSAREGLDPSPRAVKTFHQKWIRVPPGFAGPIDSDLVLVEHDEDAPYARARSRCAREVGQSEADRCYPSREGWRSFAVLVEDDSPWHERWTAVDAAAVVFPPAAALTERP